MAKDRLRNGLVRFRVRITRITSKDLEVNAEDMYKAQSIGRSMAEKWDWTDVDNISYSSLAEPWSLSACKKKK